MSLKEKISLKKYFFGTFVCLLLIVFAGGARGLALYIQLLMLACASINQLLLVKGTQMLFHYQLSGERSHFKAFAMIFGKTILLGGAFLAAVHYTPEHLLTCLFIYIFQLIILALSIKR